MKALDSLEQLKAAEKEIDVKIATLPLLSAPIRVLTYGLFSVLKSLFHGTILTKTSPRPEAGHSLAARLYTLIPLLRQCPGKPEGASARNAADAYLEIDPTGVQALTLLTYAHYSQIMPEVHRGYYSVSGSLKSGFELHYRSEDFARFELEDFLLNEIATPFLSRPGPEPEVFDQLARTAPTLDATLMIYAQRNFQKHYLGNIYDDQLVSDKALVAAAGVTHTEFNRFRAVLFALAETATQLSRAIEKRLQLDPSNEQLFDEMLEWDILNWKYDFVAGMIQHEAHLSSIQTDRLLELFTLDYRGVAPKITHSGDGFFPPLVRLSESLLIIPDMVSLFIQTRNILYVAQRTQSKLFDDVISEELEPQLLGAIANLFAECPELIVKTNMTWDSGEFDLLVFDPSKNLVLVGQAKAPLPPHGARLVDRLEGRITEAVEQLVRFQSLSLENRGSILSKMLGQPMKNVVLINVVFARSCFGTQKVRTMAPDIALITLPLLAKAIADCASSATLSLTAILERCEILKVELVDIARATVIRDYLQINGIRIGIPLLSHDPAALFSMAEDWTKGLRS